jgi:hypothetical protein
MSSAPLMMVVSSVVKSPPWPPNAPGRTERVSSGRVRGAAAPERTVDVHQRLQLCAAKQTPFLLAQQIVQQLMGGRDTRQV